MEKAVEVERCAGGLIFRYVLGVPHFLVVHRPLKDGNTWTLPKGHIEQAESTEETAVREVFEEVGLENLRLVGFLEDQPSKYVLVDGRSGEKLTAWYLFEDTAEQAVVLGEEFDACAWLTAERARQIFSYENMCNLLNLAGTLLERAGAATQRTF
jgi:8-oxo-dGTP pyrophosphatase MutT (NUDIX family)